MKVQSLKLLFLFTKQPNVFFIQCADHIKIQLTDQRGSLMCLPVCNFIIHSSRLSPIMSLCSYHVWCASSICLLHIQQLVQIILHTADRPCGWTSPCPHSIISHNVAYRSRLHEQICICCSFLRGQAVSVMLEPNAGGNNASMLLQITLLAREATQLSLKIVT